MANEANETIAAAVNETPARLPASASGETLGASSETGVQSPFCGSLRSKKFFLLDRLATSADDYLDAANHVWCCETQEVIGPDNRRVDPNACGPRRACYSSAVKGL
jgi:hypothetical protein